MTKEELKRKNYDNWNRYYQRHKSEINARRKKVREDYKNKLSGAEKRIAELTEHNETLMLQIQSLGKENAELKDYRLTTLAKQQTEISKYALNLEHKLSWYDNQLTKAKELLKRCYDNYIYLQPLRNDIEQFLNSEVEK